MDKKVKFVADLFAANDPAWRTALIERFDCIKNLEDYKLLTTLLMPANPGNLVGATMTEADLIEPLLGGVAIGKVISAYGTGAAYSLTNAQAAVDFGGVDPAIVIDEPGTYMVFPQFHLSYAGAIVVAETATLKVRRTNNTAADVSVLPVIDLPAAAGATTNSYGIIQIPPFVYQTPRSDDALSLFGALSAALGTGNIDVTPIGTSLVALRISDATA